MFRPVAVSTRCVPADHCGVTAGERGGARRFCVLFARGRCADGADCTHRHRVPTKADDVASVLDGVHDVFGRRYAPLRSAWEKTRGRKEPGYADTAWATLWVGGLQPPPRAMSAMCLGKDSGGKKGGRSGAVAGSIHSQVLRCFKKWGSVIEVRVLPAPGPGEAYSALVVYDSRAAAEFARAAMEGQPLEPGGRPVPLRWAAPDSAAASMMGTIDDAMGKHDADAAARERARTALLAAASEKHRAASGAQPAPAPLPGGFQTSAAILPPPRRL